MNIYAKLAQVQQELKAPKDMRNNFGNYNYRSCESILEAVKPLLQKNGLALTLTDKMVDVAGRVYVEATATAFSTDDGNESISVNAYAREEESKKGMDSSQVTGAASSYARKYALNGLFCIDDTKDSDATNTHGKDEKPVKKENPLKKSESGEEFFFCADCHQPFRPFQKKDGTTMTAREMLALSVDTAGRPLCKDCLKKAMAK